ncbi:MAG: hypothetical protein LUQ26_02185 [Methylococcaceae bacterium]|nr:hypothetical protein [Methylococcaceae bacterium]
MTYSEFQHKHNFSVWAGARAAQRGFTSVELLRDSLDQSGIKDFVKNMSSINNSAEFDESHKKWCNSICDYLYQKGIQNVTYGRAAKLVAVYLKAIVVLADLQSIQAKFIHPPIDRILLQNVSKKSGLPKDEKQKLRSINWTQLDGDEYFVVLEILRKIVNTEPFWKIEEYWTVTND